MAWPGSFHYLPCSYQITCPYLVKWAGWMNFKSKIGFDFESASHRDQSIHVWNSRPDWYMFHHPMCA